MRGASSNEFPYASPFQDVADQQPKGPDLHGAYSPIHELHGASSPIHELPGERLELSELEGGDRPQ